MLLIIYLLDSIPIIPGGASVGSIRLAIHVRIRPQVAGEVSFIPGNTPIGSVDGSRAITVSSPKPHYAVTEINPGIRAENGGSAKRKVNRE